MTTDITQNLEQVRSQISEAAKKSGRSPDEIQLIAVSKTHDAEKVRAAFDAGQEIFGESRVQEARVKIPLLPSAVRWHFIGRLQKTKCDTHCRCSNFFTASIRFRWPRT